MAGAARLRSLDVCLATGNGTPCRATDVQYAEYGVPLAEGAISLTVDVVAVVAARPAHLVAPHGSGHRQVVAKFT